MKPYLLPVLPLLLLAGTIVHAQWESRTNGLPSGFNAIAVDALNSSDAVVAISHVYKTTNGGELWEQAGTINGVIDLSMIDPSHIWACTMRGEIFATTNGGTSWTKQFVDSSRCTFMNYVRMFDMNVGIAMGDGLSGSAVALFLKTTDGGAHWISRNDSAFGGYSFDMWRPISFPTSQVGFFASFGVNPSYLWKTTDAGSSWTRLDYPGNPAYRVSFANTQVGVACPSFSNQLFRTLDGGVSWEAFTAPILTYCLDLEFVPGNPAKVYMSNKDAILFSNDTCRTWTPVCSGRIDDIVFTDEHNGWAVGFDSLLLRTTTGGLASVQGSDRQEPAEFSLSQNWPNPFNPNTNIGYSVGVVSGQSSVGSDVRLAVYDLLGREVAVLVDGKREPGIYTVTLDASRLASGMYLYRLQAGEFIQIRKMLVLR